MTAGAAWEFVSFAFDLPAVAASSGAGRLRRVSRGSGRIRHQVSALTARMGASEAHGSGRKPHDRAGSPQRSVGWATGRLSRRWRLAPVFGDSASLALAASLVAGCAVSPARSPRGEDRRAPDLAEESIAPASKFEERTQAVSSSSSIRAAKLGPERGRRRGNAPG